MKNLKVNVKMIILSLCVIILAVFSILLSCSNMKKVEKEALDALEETIRGITTRILKNKWKMLFLY